MKRSSNYKIAFIPYFYASFFIGMIALEIGIILPFLMDEMNLNYSLAGGILSAFAIGNLVASLINPVLTRKLNAKYVTVLFSSLLTISLFLMTLLPSFHVLYGIVIFIGIGRGTINIHVYASANKDQEGKTILVHLLSIIFAVGALTAPIITSILLHYDLNWKYILYIFIIFSMFVPISLLFYHQPEELSINKATSMQQFSEKHTYQHKNNTNTSVSYYKNLRFYLLGGVLFCYIGLENCVNGWFVQYFKETNRMPAAYANMLVSITWLLILTGRLMTAVISTKIKSRTIICINSIGTAAFFILMIISKNPVIITFSIASLGFFSAGIYPSCIADSKRFLNNSSSGMSLLLAFSSMGGILIPQVIGILADHIGLVSSIVYLVIIMVGMVSFSVLNYLKYRYD